VTTEIDPASKTYQSGSDLKDAAEEAIWLTKKAPAN